MKTLLNKEFTGIVTVDKFGNLSVNQEKPIQKLADSFNLSSEEWGKTFAGHIKLVIEDLTEEICHETV